MEIWCLPRPFLIPCARVSQSTLRLTFFSTSLILSGTSTIFIPIGCCLSNIDKLEKYASGFFVCFTVSFISQWKPVIRFLHHWHDCLNGCLCNLFAFANISVSDIIHVAESCWAMRHNWPRIFLKQVDDNRLASAIILTPACTYNGALSSIRCLAFLWIMTVIRALFRWTSFP